MTDKILMAMVGGSDGSRPCGMMVEGFCIPLAATDEAREAIEAAGEQSVCEWMERNNVEHPGAGGLWVLDCDLLADDSEEGWKIDNYEWREPFDSELAGLVARQTARSNGESPEPPDGEGRWAFIGALV